MGTYLTNGIVQDITIEKRVLERQHVTIAAVTESLKKEVNIDCYNRSEDSDAYYWNIKPEMFNDNFVEFLDAQFRMYCDEKGDNFQKVIDAITAIKTTEEIITLAGTNSLSCFQLLDNLSNYIEVVRDVGFTSQISVDYRLISYFMDGKIIMECYKNILKYFEHNIRLQRDKYPIVDCVKVMITS